MRSNTVKINWFTEMWGPKRCRGDDSFNYFLGAVAFLMP